LQKILDLCPTIIASQDDADKWQTRDEFYKPNVGKLILNEAEKILASNKERMHFQDLFRKIKNQFPQIDIPERYLSAKLHYDPRFNCIAKKGYWFLTEWNYQTGSILECLLIILKDATDSMTLNELVVEVQKMNPSKPGSIKVTLQNRSDVFIKLPGNRYDLRERYPNRSKSDDEF
jgi:DNA-directed RNA polymerase delta subunit